MTRTSAATEENKRKRKTHVKSRRGCRNCKLRRVKCDETRPECQKCFNYGVTCNFDPNVPDLQMCHDGTMALKTGLQYTPQVPSPLNQISRSKLPVPDFLYPAIDADFRFDREFLDRFGRFKTRTVLSIGTPGAAVLFQAVAVNLSFSHAYLMHSAQTLTAIHDRHLSALPWPISSQRTSSEIYHLTRAAALLNRKLSEPIKDRDRDPMWATAALLGIIAFASIDATSPEEAWPLKATGPTDFEWIEMSEHKMAVWNAVKPSRPESLFYVLTTDHAKLFGPDSVIQTEVGDIPSDLAELYELNESSTPENNPYYTAVQKMAILIPTECERADLLPFLGFISKMEPRFKSLVYSRDPRALLLMAYWYAKVGRAVWWLERRTLLEGQSTCLYLERYHPEETAIHKLLQFPKMKLGLLGGSWGDS